MAKSKDSEILGECAYCPNPGTTKDHIPPQTIYAKGTQHKPWVPACRSCNGGASKDDEYMQRLAMLWGADRSKDAAAAEERFFKALEREQQFFLGAQRRQRSEHVGLKSLSLTKEYPYWSQVSVFTTGRQVVAEHNVIRDGEWIVRFVEGEFRYNLISHALFG